MSPLRQVMLIAQRDFLQRIRSRAFLVSMLLIVGVVVIAGPLLAAESAVPKPYKIGTTGTVQDGFNDAVTASAKAFDRTVEVSSYASTAEGEAALEKGDVNVLLVDGEQLVWNQDPNYQLTSIVTSAVQGLDRAKTIASLGLSQEEAARLLAPTPLASRSLTAPDPSQTPKQVASYVGSILLYISILMFGQFVMIGVMEEKQSRVVEVVLSRTRPRHLLAGKVLGIGLLGVIQLVVIGGAALFTLSRANVVNVDLAGIGTRVALTVLAWYLLGYALFAVLYAALGATISRQEDAQGVAFIPILVIVPGFFLSIFALEEPNALLPHLGSIIPPFSPFVMPTRMTVTNVPTWEVALSVVLILLATYWVLRLGARIYQGSILRIGAKVKLRDALRAGSEQ
jgi:ABC-2 type transport system permease protein